MISAYYTPCELILKIGSNECDGISTAISSLLRTCSISDQSFFVVERQIQPTTYYGSFTSQHSQTTSPPIPSQSLSCVLLLTDDILKQQQLVRSSTISSTGQFSSTILPKSKHFFKSVNIWNFHHKIELLDEHKQPLARQDYYELSHSLPLWSVSHIPHSRQPIVRFNIFTQHFESLLTFYTRLFQQKPDSSKPGFVLFILPSSPHSKIIYQFSIKYSPSIQPYTIAQSAYFKFRLNNLDQFLNEYSSKLFALNKSEYYIYDPDGNLLHLHLYNLSNLKAIEESNHLKAFFQATDSGVGDSSDPPTATLFSSTIPQGYKPFHPAYYDRQQNQKQVKPLSADIDVQSHSSQSSHDSGRWSSMSSNELNPINRTKRTVHQIPITIVNSTSRLTSGPKENEIRLEEAIHNYRLQRQHQRTVPPRTNPKRQEQLKCSLYDSEPRLSNLTCVNNRYYSSMNDVQIHNRLHSFTNNQPKPTFDNYVQATADQEFDISYEVDSPRIQQDTSHSGYLHAFLLKRRQQQQQQRQSQVNCQGNIQQLITSCDKPNSLTMSQRPLSAPLIDLTTKPMKGILQRRINGAVTPIMNKSLRKRSKSVTFDCHSDAGESTSSEDEHRIDHVIDQLRSPRINIGITLDSRLRKTPVLEMLRSTAMEPDLTEIRHLGRTTSLRQTFLPIARF